MNASTSDYSSGCESGWTTYLDHYSNSDPYYTTGFYDQHKCINDDDEDLSMVSDASSAPPHSAYNYSYAPEEKKKSKSKSKSKTRKEAKEQNLQCLDDTASSSLFHFSQDNVPPSHHQNSVGVESVTKKRLSNFFKSSTKGKSGNLEGRKRQ